jgi:hypothetical protein
MFVLAVSLPWWGTGVFTLAGGAVVALIPQLFNVYTTRRRVADEKMAADQALRREALLTYLTSATQYVNATDDSRKETQAEFELARVRLELLVNDTDFKNAASRYWSAMYELRRTKESADRDKIAIEAIDAEEALIQGARRSERLFGLPA